MPPEEVAVSQDKTAESLPEELEHILEEARMVLPGLQALFGFQLIAVFNERFDHGLGDPGKRLHLAALILTAVAIGLVMAPAAYHRIAERDRASRYFANYASLLIALAMAPLAVSLSAEVLLVAYLAVHGVAVSCVLAAALLTFLIWLWYVFPMRKKRRPVSTLRRKKASQR
jgi:Family of unknown function (DUF6328)